MTLRAAVQLQAVDLELSLVLNTSIQLPHPQPHPPLFLYFSSFSPATLPDPAASRSYLIFRERSGVPLLLWRCVLGQNVATGRSACSRRDSRINGRRGYEAAAGVTHRVLWWDLLGSQKLDFSAMSACSTEVSSTSVFMCHHWHEESAAVVSFFLYFVNLECIRA